MRKSHGHFYFIRCDVRLLAGEKATSAPELLASFAARLLPCGALPSLRARIVLHDSDEPVKMYDGCPAVLFTNPIALFHEHRGARSGSGKIVELLTNPAQHTSRVSKGKGRDLYLPTVKRRYLRGPLVLASLFRAGDMTRLGISSSRGYLWERRVYVGQVNSKAVVQNILMETQKEPPSRAGSHMKLAWAQENEKSTQAIDRATPLTRTAPPLPTSSPPPQRLLKSKSITLNYLTRRASFLGPSSGWKENCLRCSVRTFGACSRVRVRDALTFAIPTRSMTEHNTMQCTKQQMGFAVRDKLLHKESHELASLSRPISLPFGSGWRFFQALG